MRSEESMGFMDCFVVFAILTLPCNYRAITHPLNPPPQGRGNQTQNSSANADSHNDNLLFFIDCHKNPADFFAMTIKIPPPLRRGLGGG